MLSLEIIGHGLQMLSIQVLPFLFFPPTSHFSSSTFGPCWNNHSLHFFLVLAIATTQLLTPLTKKKKVNSSKLNENSIGIKTLYILFFIYECYLLLILIIFQYFLSSIISHISSEPISTQLPTLASFKAHRASQAHLLKNVCITEESSNEYTSTQMPTVDQC